LTGSQVWPLRALAGKARKQDGVLRVPVELRGRRGDGREVLHSRGEVVLVNALPTEPARLEAGNHQPYPIAIEEAYRRHLFHGPRFCGLVRVEGISPAGITATVRTAPPPSAWMEQPP